MENEEIRWRQIFENFNAAYLELRKYKGVTFTSKLEKAGYIHYFEIALEQAFRLIFAFLKAKGISTDNNLHAIKEMKKFNIIVNQQAWNKAFNRRKLPLFLHKNEKLFDELVVDINNEYLPELETFWTKLREIL
jgi:hypothetical protein